jgi:hypothetical protein
MLFGVKNEPPTYQRAMTKAFREYLDSFMKIFLDDFTVYTWRVICRSLDYVFKSAKNMALVSIQKNVHLWYFQG